MANHLKVSIKKQNKQPPPNKQKSQHYHLSVAQPVMLARLYVALALGFVWLMGHKTSQGNERTGCSVAN